MMDLSATEYKLLMINGEVVENVAVILFGALNFNMRRTILKFLCCELAELWHHSKKSSFQVA